MFERDDLDCEPFLRNLRRTVSDDGLLSKYLDTTSLNRVRRVQIGGTIRETLERHVRFTQIGPSAQPPGHRRHRCRHVASRTALPVYAHLRQY